MSYYVKTLTPKRGAATVTAQVRRKGEKSHLFSVKGTVEDLSEVVRSAEFACFLLLTGHEYKGYKSNHWWQRFRDPRFMQEMFNGPARK